MRIRHRLTLAFFALSVLPVAVVTGYSYYSSASALRRAAQSQAEQMAADMGQRMIWVLADLGDRVQRAWHMQPGAPPDTVVQAGGRRPSGNARMAESVPPTGGVSTGLDLQAQVKTALAEAAPMVERLVFLSAPEPPDPTAPEPAPGRREPAARETAPRRPRGEPGAAPAPKPPSPRVVVDVTLPRQPGRAPGSARVVVPYEPPTREALEAWRRAMQEQAMAESEAFQREEFRAQIDKAAAAAVDAGRVAARVVVGERKRAETLQRLKALTAGKSVTFPVVRDGKVVGEVDATVNRHRMIDTVLGLARRDRGEVPFVLDVDDEVHTSTPDEAQIIERLNLDRQALAALPGQTSRTIGDWVVVTRHDESGIVFGIARPLADSLRDMRLAALRNLGVGMLLVVGLFSVIAPLASRLTRHISTLTDGVQRLARGERGTRVVVPSHDEIGELAAAFNRMAGEIEAHEKALVGRERLRRELELCRQIQADMLPHGTLRLGLAEVTGVSIPAREVGGDFFNYFALADGRIALLVGDVSGKGVGAALLMANVQATLRARMPLETDLPSLVAALDQDVAVNTPPEVFLTLFIAILDPVRGELGYVNAGHNPQFLLRADGAIESLESSGLAVGLMPGHPYEQRTARVRPGDFLFFYTDGAVEVENEAGDMFGSERLREALTAASSADVAGILSGVESAIQAFRGAAEPNDDATMMAVRLGHAPEARQERP